MKNNQSGQSTVEFILTFIFGVSIVLLIFNSALNYASGYLVHYANFMASRTLLTTDSHNGSFGTYQVYESEATALVTSTYKKYALNIFKVPDSGFKIHFPQANANPGSGEYLQVGTSTTFKQKMDAISWITGNSMLDLVSESFLGKEPTRSACATRVCFAITGSESCSETQDLTLFDDGC